VAVRNGKGIDMRHIGILAGAALVALMPTMASAQTGAPAGAPMQAGGWGQGGWQPGGNGAPGYAPQGYAPHGDWQQDRGRHGHGDYRRLERGKRLPHAYLDPSYTVSDWNDWGFAPPGPGMRWVRYYDDGLLIDADGRIVNACYGVAWDRGPMRGPRGGFVGGPGGFPGGPGGGHPGGPGFGYPAPGVSTYRAGPNTTVTTTVVQAPPPLIVGGPALGYAGYGGYAGGGTVISVTPGVAVTTTTTSTDYETVYKSVAVRQKVWRRPIRHYRPRCVHTTSCPILGS
jgi:Ni/Co efflux regulator RcnB